MIARVLNIKSPEISLEVKALKSFRKNSTKAIAIMMETKLKIIVSPMNCPNNFGLLLPKTFFIPISFDLLAELAVVRFIKLMHANRSTISAIVESIYTYWMLLFGCIS